MQDLVQTSNRQVELRKQQDQFLQNRRTAQAQPVAAFEQIEQQVSAVQGKEVGLRARPARQNVVRADQMPV